MTNSLATNGGHTQGEGRAIPWTPYRDIFGFDPFQALRSNWAFEYDVSKTETGYEVEGPVPGYKPEQIDVTFKDGVLSVNGKSDRRTFSRSFSVPEDVNSDHIAARVADGMLTQARAPTGDAAQANLGQLGGRGCAIYKRADAFDDAATTGLRPPILFDDSPNVIGAWMKLYRFGLPALN